MQVKEAIFARRAIKHFDPDHAMTTAEEKELFETMIQAPTSFKPGQLGLDELVVENGF